MGIRFILSKSDSFFLDIPVPVPDQFIYNKTIRFLQIVSYFSLMLLN